MKKILSLAIAVICFLFLSCQRSQPPETKKEVRVQKEEIKQPPLVESKSLDQTKEDVKESIQKKEEKEIPLVKKPSPLTEEEQREFERFGGGWITPNVFKTEKEAMRILKILVKGDEKSIRWYQVTRLTSSGNEQEEQKTRKIVYSEDLATALSAVNTRINKEAFDLAVQVLKSKREYPEALARAALVVKFAHDPSVIPLLREIVNYHVLSVRLQAAGSLLFLGDADTALPVLDELTREGATSALGFIFHNMQGKEWEQRGVAIIRKTLTYENNESKALAALFLIGLTKKGFLKEDMGELEDILTKISEEILAKKKWPISSYGYDDGRAIETVILAFEDIGSKRAIQTLERIATHPEAGYLRRKANEAIKHISEKERGAK